MAGETLVKETLSENMVKEGSSLTSALDNLHLDISAAFWMFYPETNTWKYRFASSQTKNLGPLAIYKAVQNALAEGKFHYIKLSDVSIIDENHPLLSGLAAIIKTGNTIQNIRFSRNVVNGQFIEDLLIYRLR